MSSNWTQGFAGADLAEVETGRTGVSDAVIEAAREAAVVVIKSGAVGDGPYNVSVSGSEDGVGTLTVTVSISGAPRG